MSSKKGHHLANSNSEQEGKVSLSSNNAIIPIYSSHAPIEPKFQFNTTNNSTSPNNTTTVTASNTAFDKNHNSSSPQQSHVHLNHDHDHSDNSILVRRSNALHPSLPTNNHNQRSNKKSPSVPPSSSQSPRDFKGGKDAWQSMLYNLLAYKVNHNNQTNVKYEKENTQEHSLYLWLQNQRKHYKYFIDGKQSFLNEERVKILECVGVEWNVRGDVFWENMYEKLREYKKTHGDTLVPRKWEKNKKLGEWVTDQRRQHKYKISNKSSLLTDERERKLNEVGFIWSLRNRTDWNHRFEELIKFKQEYGHCIVPQLFTQNKGLGKWVSKQREQYRRLLDNKYSFMTKERIEKLNEIGFSWNAKGRRNVEPIVGTDIMKPALTARPAILETNNVCEKAPLTSDNNKNSEEKSVLPMS